MVARTDSLAYPWCGSQRPFRAALIATVTVSLLTGCAASIDEQHYIATFGEPTPLNPTGFANVMRITIDGNAGFANVRYIAGHYDEYAADLFLNNVKSSPYSSSTGVAQGANTIFSLCVPADNKASSGDTAGGSDGDGAQPALKDGDNKACKNSVDGDTFLIIMSTNADAIAETIGAFAENQVAIKSLNYLLNREVFDAQHLTTELQPQVTSERKAMLASLEALFAEYEARDAASVTDEIAILQTIAVALNPTGNVAFTEIEEAKAWLSEAD